MSSSHDRFPSLTALRAFEAAARHGSLTRAARELHVTQGAVSRQVQALERDLGLPLFGRAGRRLALTAAGEELAAPVGEAMDMLRAAAARARRRARSNTVTVSMLPSLAAKWFTPRIGRMIRDLPALDLRVHASRAPANFASDAVDCAIRYGRGDWPDVRATLLMREEIFPAAAPSLVAAHGLRGPADLFGVPLLRDDLADSWDAYFAAAGLPGPPGRPAGPAFTDAVSLIEAAVDGIGVALVRSRLVERELREGTLAAVGDTVLSASRAYHLVCPEGPLPAPVEALFAWLRMEVGVP